MGRTVGRARAGAIASAIASVLVVYLAGCAGDPKAGSAQEADQLAAAWLTALQDEASPDRGWELLDADTRDHAYGNDAPTYLAEVRAADWDAFEWQIAPPTYWEGDWVVHVSIPGGSARAPEFMFRRGLAQPMDLDGRDVGMTLAVSIDFAGSRGIAAYGAGVGEQSIPPLVTPVGRRVFRFPARRGRRRVLSPPSLSGRRTHQRGPSAAS